MSTKDQRTKHFLFSGVPAWGHIRPFCILAARLVNENEHVVVTMLIAPKLLGKAQSEVTAEFDSSRSYSEDARQRVRILSTFQSASNDTLSLMTTLAETYTSTYQALTEGKEITCAVKGTVFAPVPAPSVLILDFVALPQLHATRAISGQSVPIVAWITGHAATRLRMFGPESMGGLGDVAGKTEAEAARLGVTPEEVGHKFVRPTDGEVVSLPGLPPMFDYEFYPQKRDSPPLSLKIYRGCYTVLKECDDVMVAAPEAFEKEPLNAMRTWFSDWKKDTYSVGPLLPLNYGTEAKHLGSAVDTEIEAFLDHKLELHGEKSVLFMSFGTLFWPATPEYVEETIDALIEKKFPFIFCYASPRATISDELVQKVKDSHLSILTPWAPQQFILNHPATGWFLTHCGQNSVTEALTCGVPMIAWPFESDQPAAAALLSEILKVAVELIEVRTGEYGLKPLRRNGRAAKGTREAVGAEIRQVLDECRGQKGAELRKNAESMKAQFVDAWKDDGVARMELRRFLAKYL